MADKQDNNTQKKITNEKPVSLAKLTFQEALTALLKTPPPPKETKKKTKNNPSK